ncbi:LON peptidase substrate-binding domain-containing protein [Vibrio sonorensis]|uniref:LON peptidase substrate-binding domain-containing protein n=1 Tax=Vibrio sonorensis TaxID=1004316 RepID=UPI0008DA6426|nr:LON peptidase substrate-binding domain-containing protein [Vibrio sonorensis]
MSQVMLFPLGSIVLPEGKMKLRIFEPRYKRLVSQALKGDACFGICLLEKGEGRQSAQLSQIGCRVRIVDFESLDGGLLGITVVGEKRFLIKRVRTEYDGLRIATVDWRDEWQMREVTDGAQGLSDRLRDLYMEFPQVGELYEQCFFDDTSWVCQRWIEILPLTNEQFDSITRSDDCFDALQFLNNAIEFEKTRQQK